MRTARLVLEPLRVEHASEMVAVLADPALYEFIGGSPPEEAELAARYARQVGHAGWLNWIVREDGRAVGTVQATVTGETAELAWVIGTADQGRGLATEAMTAVRDRLRAEGVTELRAHIHPGHAASAAVARHLGMHPTDVVHDGEVRWVSGGPATVPAMGRPRLRDVGTDPDPRFTFANERTYLAWNRTALALIGGGLAAAQLLHFDSHLVRLLVSLPPILIGGVLAWTSYGRWEANERAMRLREPLPATGPPRFLAAALALVAVALAVLVLVDAIHA